MKKLLNMFRGHRPDGDALSAYLDRRLTANEHAAVEAHVAGCAACREHLAGLQEVRATLRAIPQADAPRSFRVRQADVQAAPKGVLREAAPWTRALPALGGVAAAIFVVAVAIDVRGGGADEQLASGRAMSELSDTTARAGGIVAESGDDASTSAGAPAPLAPGDSFDTGAGGGEGDSGAADAATSAPPQTGNTSIESDAKGSPDVEAARDATATSDGGGWPLARYIAVVAAISGLAALGVWLGFTVERRFN